MAYRSRDWNEGLAEDLKDPEFASQFVQACLDEGIPENEVVAKLVKAYGIAELSRETHIASPNILRIARDPEKARLNTVNRLLKPLGLGFRIGRLAGLRLSRKSRLAAKPA